MTKKLVALKCIKSDGSFFTKGKTYDVHYTSQDTYYIKSDHNVKWHGYELEFLNSEGIYFEKILSNENSIYSYSQEDISYINKLYDTVRVAERMKKDAIETLEERFNIDYNQVREGKVNGYKQRSE